MTSALLEIELKQILKRYRVPGIAAAVQVGDITNEAAAVGKREIGGDKRLTINDKWRIGSCTKPMTATLAGILIDHGVIGWTTTIGEVFQFWKNEIHHDWHRVTLEQLLAHHSGASRNGDAYAQRPSERIGTATEQRISFVRSFLSNSPELPPNRRFQYSNAGYGIAGLMLETCTKRPWESLMNDFIFEPLGMTSAGFDDPTTDDAMHQPLGHALTNRKLRPVDPDSVENSPAAIGPGATAQCSIQDFLHFAVSHAGANTLLKEDTFHRLHRRFGASEYACGWFVVERYWGNGYVIWHSGNTFGWNATTWIAPLRRVAFVAATNDNRTTGANACNQAINQMITRLL